MDSLLSNCIMICVQQNRSRATYRLVNQKRRSKYYVNTSQIILCRTNYQMRLNFKNVIWTYSGYCSLVGICKVLPPGSETDPFFFGRVHSGMCDTFHTEGPLLCVKGTNTLSKKIPGASCNAHT